MEKLERYQRIDKNKIGGCECTIPLQKLEIRWNIYRYLLSKA